MDSSDNQFDIKNRKLFNKKHKIVNTLSYSVFIIHGIVILILLAFILKGEKL